MTNNAIVRTLKPDDDVRLTLPDGRTFTGKVSRRCDGLRMVMELRDSSGGTFSIWVSRLHLCNGTLEVCHAD